MWPALLAVAATFPGGASVPAAIPDPPRLVLMLRSPPRSADTAARREALTSRLGAAGLRLRDTLAVPGVPWTLRVLRAEVDGLLLAAALDLSPEPAGSPFAGAPRWLADLARRLAADPAVAWAEPEYLREPAHVVDDSLPPEPLLRDTRQWGLWNAGPGSAYGGAARADIHAIEAWRRMAALLDRAARARASSGDLRADAAAAVAGSAPADARPPAAPVLLAVADTGIDPAHPEFADASSGATRIVHARSIADPAASVHDSLGHGTMVAAVMAAATGEGAHFDSLGMAGVCGNCAIMPLRITRGARRTASSFDIALAIMTAAEQGARAVNLSFAGGGRSRLERLALAHAIARGTLVVAASGNRGYTDPDLPMYPAAYAADGLCLAAGASDMWDRRAAFSSHGAHLDLVAPGLNIWSAWMTYPAATGAAYPGYVAGSGTSFAAPFATGVIGLLAAARGELGAEDLRHVLRGSADDIGAPGPDAETGAGRLNAAAALATIAAGTGIWHDEVAAGAWDDDGAGTLAIAEDGPGTFAARRSGAAATRVAFEARFTLPDSFADGARIWPRVAGTSTLRADFEQPWHAPWCEARLEGRTAVLRGYAFRLEAGADPGAAADDAWIPLPPDQMRFAFTVMGAVRRDTAAAPRPVPGALSAFPNPTRGAVRIEVPDAGTLAVLDVRGRVIWRAAAGRNSRLEWPGTDAAGRAVPPGLYLVVFEGGGIRRTARVVRLS